MSVNAGLLADILEAELYAADAAPVVPIDPRDRRLLGAFDDIDHLIAEGRSDEALALMRPIVEILTVRARVARTQGRYD